MTTTLLFTQLQDSVDAASQILKTQPMNQRATTVKILELLRAATCAAQELDNRTAGNKPKEIAP